MVATVLGPRVTFRMTSGSTYSFASDGGRLTTMTAVATAFSTVVEGGAGGFGGGSTRRCWAMPDVGAGIVDGGPPPGVGTSGTNTALPIESPPSGLPNDTSNASMR